MKKNRSISQKLDFLMKLTDTSNSALAKALSFDASYISRIRNGERGIPLHQPFVEPAAAYFSRRINNTYQRKVLSDVLNNGTPISADSEAIEHILLNFLSNDSSSAFHASGFSVERFIKETSAFHRNKAALEMALNVTASGISPAVSDGLSMSVSAFYGNTGKREATLAFLQELAAANVPHELLLYSDEDSFWMYEDPAYIKRWLPAMLSLMKTGTRIKIIHTLSRDINEMFEALKNWMPLYSTGMIEPYYYPRIRDGVYRRTLFIARKHSAITSSSVEGKTEHMINFLVRDNAAVKALTCEFENYFALCRPLMRIYTQKDAFAASLQKFTAQKNTPYFHHSTNDVYIIVKETQGAFVIYAAEHFSAFFFDEPRMIAAVLEYLTQISALRDKDFETFMKKLYEYLGAA